MFGISEKEFERQQHQQRMQTSLLKAEAFEKALANSSEELVLLGDIVLRKSFITKVEKGKDCTFIYFLSFNLKGHIESLTDYKIIKDSVLSFDQISALLTPNQDSSRG